MECNYRDRVLEYLRGDSEDEEAERHLETCETCRAMMEGYLEKERELEIPAAGYAGEDKVLKEQVTHFEKGTRRIVVFTLVGLVLGWFSIAYISDSFIVTKIILAIPYKISEAIHNLIHTHPYSYYEINGMLTDFNEFFPNSRLLTFLAERLTPVLIGGAIYGSLAYFTGDSRIFTLKRYLKFAAVWAGIILLWNVGLLALNRSFAQKDDLAEDVTGFFLVTEERGSGFYENNDDSDVGAMICGRLKNALYSDGNPLVRLYGIERRIENELQLCLYLGKIRQGTMIVFLNPKDNYMVTEYGTVYQIPEEFSDYMMEFQRDCFDSMIETLEEEGGEPD